MDIACHVQLPNIRILLDQLLVTVVHPTRGLQPGLQIFVIVNPFLLLSSQRCVNSMCTLTDTQKAFTLWHPHHYDHGIYAFFNMCGCVSMYGFNKWLYECAHVRMNGCMCAKKLAGVPETSSRELGSSRLGTLQNGMDVGRVV